MQPISPLSKMRKKKNFPFFYKVSFWQRRDDYASLSWTRPPLCFSPSISPFPSVCFFPIVAIKLACCHVIFLQIDVYGVQMRLVGTRFDEWSVTELHHRPQSHRHIQQSLAMPVFIRVYPPARIAFAVCRDFLFAVTSTRAVSETTRTGSQWWRRASLHTQDFTYEPC